MVGFLKKLFGANKPKPAPVKPLLSDNLLVFAGTFASELAATDYGLGLATDATLSGDLAGAGIGVDDVEIIFGLDRIAATRPMLNFIGPARPTGDANALLLLSDRGTDPTTLTGDRVAYIGTCSVS